MLNPEMKFPEKSAEYDDLNTITGTWKITYGPVQSRRLGRSLGINLSGSNDKICNYNCPYCELGSTELKMLQVKKYDKFPTLEQIDFALRGHLVTIARKQAEFDVITISGYGEPTLHPEFVEAVDLIRKLRDEMAPEIKLAILTNGANLDNTKILRAVNDLDIKIVKVDAGNDAMMEKVNAPLIRTGTSKVIQAVKKVTNLTIQSMFVQGAVDNTTKSELDDWMEIVGILKPQMVQIYTIDRVPAVSGLKAVPQQKLKEIAINFTKKTGIKAQAFI